MSNVQVRGGGRDGGRRGHRRYRYRNRDREFLSFQENIQYPTSMSNVQVRGRGTRTRTKEGIGERGEGLGEREIAIEIGIGFRVQDLESPWDRQTVCGPGGLESLVSLKSLRTDKSGTGLISRFMVMKHRNNCYLCPDLTSSNSKLKTSSNIGVHPCLSLRIRLENKGGDHARRQPDVVCRPERTAHEPKDRTGPGFPPPFSALRPHGL